MHSKIKKKKSLTVIVLLPLAVLVLTVCLFSGKLFFLNRPVFVFNHSYFIVSSPSMQPAYPMHSLIVVKKEPLSRIKKGDVIVFKADALGGGLAFHRVVRVTEDGVYTKGDANAFEDNQLITKKTYVAKGVFKNYALGRYLFLASTPLGFILLFLLPIFALWLIFTSIFRLVRLNKKL